VNELLGKLEIDDAFGQEVWDHFKGERHFEIVERDDGFIDAGSFGGLVYFAKFDDWENIDKEAIKYAKGKTLDIGCGAGRHALYLQNKKFDVTGIDNSPLAIKVCKERGLEKAFVLPIVEVETLLPEKFDSILLLGHNFGLFGSFQEARSLLAKIGNVTNPGAIIISTTRDPYQSTEAVHEEYQQKNLAEGRMGGQLRLRIRHKKLIGSWFNYLFVSKEELKHIVEGSGWKVKEFIGNEEPEYGVILEKE